MTMRKLKKIGKHYHDNEKLMHVRLLLLISWNVDFTKETKFFSGFFAKSIVELSVQLADKLISL